MPGRHRMLRLSRWASVALPWPVVAAGARLMADGWRAVDRRRRCGVESHLAWVLGDRVGGASPLVRDVFRGFTRYVVEFFSADAARRPALSVEGLARLAASRARSGGGAVVVSAHLSNWELGAVALRRAGLPISGIALPHADPDADRLFVEQRRRLGIDTIPVGPGSVGAAIKRLRAGELVGVVGDWAFPRDGVAVRLCGRRVRLDAGCAVLSVRAGVPMIPGFVIRDPDGRLRLWIEPPLWPGPGPVAERIQRLLQGYADALERYLRRYPGQWIKFDAAPGDA